MVRHRGLVLKLRWFLLMWVLVVATMVDFAVVVIVMTLTKEDSTVHQIAGVLFGAAAAVTNVLAFRAMYEFWKEVKQNNNADLENS